MRIPRAFHAVAVFFGFGFLRLLGADFEVINTADNGFGSLRQAIEDANDNPGFDRIVFNIPAPGVQTIRPVTALPAITEALEIDGYSQPRASPNTLSNGFNGILLIQLDGQALAFGAGLTLRGGNSRVRGLVINRFASGLFINSSSNVVVGNLIGPAPSGRTGLGNADGITTFGECCTVVGGLLPADRNVIAGNSGNAFQIGELVDASAVASTNLSILGNFLGTDITGLVGLPEHGFSSMLSVRGAENLILGGLEPGAGNVIATGFLGVHLYSFTRNTRILGNFVGVGSDGQTRLRNTNANTGLTVPSDAHVEGNTIAYTGTGVAVWGTRVSILNNRIYANGRAGILHGGITPTNDAGDLDTGPNELQNYPTLTAVTEGTELVLTGELQSKPSTTYTVQFFASSSPNTNGLVEGELILGSTQLTTEMSGAVAFAVRYPNPGPAFSWITATATDPEGNTSVFSPGAQVGSATFLRFQQQPQSITVSNGLMATFRAVVSGAEPITLQWRWNGADLPGARQPVLTLNNVQPHQRGTYDVVATNPFGTLTSESAQLNVLTAPLFLFQPLSQTVASGQWVTVSIGLSPFTSTPIGMRWRSNATFFPWMVGTQYNSFFTFLPGAATANLSVQITNVGARLGVFSSIAVIKLAADRDQDGLPDDYETAAHLDADDPTDASRDEDNDQFTAREEYIAGTDPQDASSHLQLYPLVWTNGTTTLSFAAVSNKTYRIQYREAATPGLWQTLTSLPARPTNGPVTVSDKPTTERRFYRLHTPARP